MLTKLLTIRLQPLMIKQSLVIFEVMRNNRIDIISKHLPYLILFRVDLVVYVLYTILSRSSTFLNQLLDIQDQLPDFITHPEISIYTQINQESGNN